MRRCQVAAPWRCGMLPIYVANIIIIWNIVSILTIYFAKNFTVLSFKTHPHTMPAHRRGLPWHETNKKSAPPKKNTPAANSGASCVLRVVSPYRMDSRHNRPSPRLFSRLAPALSCVRHFWLQKNRPFATCPFFTNFWGKKKIPDITIGDCLTN